MDRGKRPNQIVSNRNNKIYMDLKDIIRENALPFLPAKSLFRFQGVCRDWKLQISTPFFAHNQSLSCRAISGLFFQLCGSAPSFVSVDPKSCGVPDSSLKFLPAQVEIVTSSNGLLCCKGCTGDKAYYICNPVTKQYQKLPKPTADHGPDPAIVLVFEPSLLNFVAEYMLICAFPSAEIEDATEFEIYSSTEGTWKCSGEICYGCKKLVPRSGLHVNGVVYWHSKHYGILAFDIKKDRSQLLRGCYYNKESLGVMDGKLCSARVTGRDLVVQVLSNVYSNTMHMGSHAKMWEEKVHVTLDAAVVGDIDRALVVFSGSDKLIVHSGKKLFSYDLKTKETAVLSRAVEFDMRCVPYVNSLAYI